MLDFKFQTFKISKQNVGGGLKGSGCHILENHMNIGMLEFVNMII